MITENLSTLKIHKLTQEQYERELEAGRIDPNAIYLTPDEEADLSGYATTEQLEETNSNINYLSILVGDKAVSEQIEEALKLVSDEEFLAWLIEENIVSPVASASGEIYVTNNNEIYVL